MYTLCTFQTAFGYWCAFHWLLKRIQHNAQHEYPYVILGVQSISLYSLQTSTVSSRLVQRTTGKSKWLLLNKPTDRKQLVYVYGKDSAGTEDSRRQLDR